MNETLLIGCGNLGLSITEKLFLVKAKRFQLLKKTKNFKFF